MLAQSQTRGVRQAVALFKSSDALQGAVDETPAPGSTARISACSVRGCRRRWRAPTPQRADLEDNPAPRREALTRSPMRSEQPKAA